MTTLAAALAFLSTTCAPVEPGGSRAAEQLRADFPAHAGHLLGDGRAFVEEREAFTLEVSAALPGARHALTLRLPRRAAEPVVLREGALEIRVRELGVEGEGAAVGAAVVFTRAGGSSFWSASAEGFEEWLRLDAGAARGDRAAAAWEVEGASLRKVGEVVEIVDAAGVARIRVSAPRAYARSGRAVPLRLEVAGARMEIVVEGGGEEVLVDPAWTSTGMMIHKRSQHTGTLLANGKVLVAGGASGAPASAELYDPASDTWSAAGSMSVGRGLHQATRLLDGKVLVTGGLGSSPNGALAVVSAELYDPASNTWSPAAPMAHARRSHSETLLANGKILVAGGHDNAASGPVDTAEIYDPSTNTWSSAASLATARYGHTATSLADGKILVAGGVGAPGIGPFASVEIYDPAADSWSPTPPMISAHGFHAATLLATGELLVTGGFSSEMPYSKVAEVYSPALGAWSLVAPMATSRTYHTVTLLPDGKVLAAGGDTTSGLGTSSAELYDPATQTWFPTVPMSEERSLHSANLLANGKVLLAGSGNVPTAGAELYSFGSPGDPCSSPAECTNGLCVDGFCCDTACDAGACDACSIAKGADVNGTCKLFSNTPCDDGDACTTSDLCQVGKCSGTSPVVCAPVDACHSPGICAPATGVCTSPVAPDGTPCALGSCQSGVCVALPDAGTGNGGGGAGGGTTTGAGAGGAGGSTTTSAGAGGGATTSAGPGGGATTSAGAGGGATTSAGGGGGATTGGDWGGAARGPIGFGGCGCRAAEQRSRSDGLEGASLAVMVMLLRRARRRAAGLSR